MNIKRYKGFSLIEVMIALVVLAVGILGISILQTTLIKNSSNANQRSVAVSIAQKKIDDLKSYAVLTSTTAWSAETLPASGIAYTHIASSAGGAPSGSSDLAAGDIVLGNTTYTLSWDVENYLHTAALAAPIVSTPPAGYPDMKMVVVTVIWDDEGGEQQQVSLSTVIDSYPPAATALSDNSSIGSVGPSPNYTPEAAPDVIDVEVDAGDGVNRQTSKPLPDAVATGGDSNTLVTFEVVTYYSAASEILASRQEEFQTLDCECQFVAINGSAFPPAHVVWDEENNDRYDYIQLDSNGFAQNISKPTATQVNNANDVDELCTICCRDHHDDEGSDVKYVAGTTGDNNHVHYQDNGTTVAVQADNDIYVESCRFKRVDGILRVFQDWKLYDITAMDRAALADVAADGGIQDTYSSYVQDYVLNQVGVSTITPTELDAVTDILTTAGAAQQLEVRGIYIDKVYDLDGNESPTAYTDYIYENTPVNEDRLERIPFSEVNLSLLAHWTSSDVTKITVTDDPVATVADTDADYYGVYSRGYISALAVTGVSGVDITAEIANNNNGITQITNNTNSDISDPITIVVGAAAGNFNITGSYTFTFPNGDSSVDRVTPVITGGGSCDRPDPLSASNNTFSCNVASPWTGTISITVKVNGSSRCEGTAAYNGFGDTTDPALSLTGICN